MFKPFECDLRPWDAQKFAHCTAKKRIIMIGDSLMRQQFQSLACLTSNISVSRPPRTHPMTFQQHGDALADGRQICTCTSNKT